MIAQAPNGAYVAYAGQQITSTGRGTAIVTITPELARALLKLAGPHQRKLIRLSVDDRKRDLVNGRWRLTNDAISLNDSNILINAYHRLTAIDETGVTAECLLAWGFPDDSLPVLDTGRSRSAADLISMGIGLRAEDMSNPGERAAAAMVLLRWQEVDNPWKPGVVRDHRFSNAQILEAQNHFHGLGRAIRRARELRSSGLRGGDGGLWAPLLYELALVDEDVTEDFVRDLAFFENLARDSPVRMLRIRIFDRTRWPEGSRNGLHSQEWLAAMTIKAWNLYLRHEPAKSRLSWTPSSREQFPVIFRGRWWSPDRGRPAKEQAA